MANAEQRLDIFPHIFPREFFDRMKGRRGAFYLPTWEQDFVLADTPGSGSTTFLADGPELANDFASTDYSAVNEGVAVCLTSGTTP